jgi:hypothetical protein
MIVEVKVNVIDGAQAEHFEAMGMDNSVPTSSTSLYFRSEKLDGYLIFGDHILFYVNGQEHVTTYHEQTETLFQDILMDKLGDAII